MCVFVCVCVFMWQMYVEYKTNVKMTREYVRAHEECLCHSATLNFVEIILQHEICGILEICPTKSDPIAN